MRELSHLESFRSYQKSDHNPIVHKKFRKIENNYSSSGLYKTTCHNGSCEKKLFE